MEEGRNRGGIGSNIRFCRFFLAGSVQTAVHGPGWREPFPVDLCFSNSRRIRARKTGNGKLRRGGKAQDKEPAFGSAGASPAATGADRWAAQRQLQE